MDILDIVQHFRRRAAIKDRWYHSMETRRKRAMLNVLLDEYDRLTGVTTAR